MSVFHVFFLSALQQFPLWPPAIFPFPISPPPAPLFVIIFRSLQHFNLISATRNDGIFLLYAQEYAMSSYANLESALGISLKGIRKCMVFV